MRNENLDMPLIVAVKNDNYSIAMILIVDGVK